MVFKKEAGNFRRAQRAMIRVMCGTKLIDKMNIKELMELLGISKFIEMLTVIY